MMKSFRSPKTEIKSKGLIGRGCFATARIEAGEVIGIRTGEVVSYIEARCRDAEFGGFSMQVEEGLFLVPNSIDDIESMSMFINHSCSPNVGLRSQISFVAMRNIEAGEELFFDYAMNIAHPYILKCVCGADNCRKYITGDDWRDPTLQAKYKGFFDNVISLKIERDKGMESNLDINKRLVETGGPVAKLISAQLNGFDAFLLRMRGEIDDEKYEQELLPILTFPDTLGLNENERWLSSRMVPNSRLFCERTLYKCIQYGIVSSVEIGKAVSNAEIQFEDLDQDFDHGGLWTYIFPEEAKLAFILASIHRPRHVLVAGSYYGYWALNLAVALRNTASKVWLVDINEEYCTLAERNIERFGLEKEVEVVCGDAESFARNSNLEFDMVLLDAEGNEDESRLDYQGKRIYGPMAKEIVPKMNAGALLVVHNILLNHSTSSEYFSKLIQKNTAELEPFLTYVRSSASTYLEVPSTEGLGIYKL